MILVGVSGCHDSDLVVGFNLHMQVHACEAAEL